ncbi:fimbrial protein [Morganella morganii]|uniref:fimbrial protein n=1 Tax=Morganella morganii TaxID=582 RepID=UPI0005393031|nr:fimbrial protein [Morganella morganii]HEC1402864.1 type 1 fimbrial protein [Enterobacter hormaechei]EHZ6677979.1 type 1 fimbrial protein [Morganella morganii]EKU8061709.1 type 1 fimbrial protein [Morganella morganii]EKW8500960.1 type 1 fimbrial protein [Morganella morganii]ELA7731098.1 type 1 fimbrial protein [Morganella morganii]
MSMKKVVLALAVSSAMAMTAQAANQGGGKINFNGEVIDAACSIDANSLKQTVELGSVAKVQLAKGGKSTPVDFTIQLHNCDITDKTTTTVTFKGVTGGAAADGLDKAFGVSGPATGAMGVVVTDAGGKVIAPGAASSAFTLNEGDNTLNFKAYMQGATTAVTVAPGAFTATADFLMDYQ